MRLFSSVLSKARTFSCLQVLAVPVLLVITMCSGEEPRHQGGNSASQPHSEREPRIVTAFGKSQHPKL